MLSRKWKSIIACPKCNWQPVGGEEWQCSCGHTWDTFTTAGRCPCCHHQWEDTQCLACFCSSEHSAWYRSTGVQWFHRVSPN